MMTDEQILTLASKYLELHPVHGDESVWDEWCGKQEDLLKFAQEIYRKAYSTGHRDGYDDGGKNGYGEGWLEGVESVRSGVLGDYQ